MSNKNENINVWSYLEEYEEYEEELEKIVSEVFKSGKLTTLSEMTLSALMKRMHTSCEQGFVDQRSSLPAVPHGLRSTFRDWVAETGQSREAAELQLAHRFGTEVEHAYYRTDLLDDRAGLLTNWHKFLEAKI